MNILIIGLGSIAAKHVSAIRALQKTGAQPHRIFALRSSKQAGSVEGVENVYSYDEARRLNPDMVIISNPTSRHADAISETTGWGVPLMIEKPVAEAPMPQADVDAIASSTLTYVACNLRFLGCLRFIADRISSGTLPGRINEVNIYCGSSLPSWRPGTDYRKSYSAIPELGGGVHLDLIHEIDYACALFGMPAESRGICRSVSSLGIRAIDFANYNLIYPEFCVSITLNYYRPTYKRTMEIVFDNDIWTADLALNTVTDGHGNVVFSSPLRIADTYTDQMDHFIKLVESGAKTSANDIRRANDILKIASSYERSI